MVKNCLRNLADYIRSHGRKSSRNLGQIFNRSKSSVHRKQQKIKARSHISGAEFFESIDGQNWLARLVIALVFIFGIGAGVGSEKLSLFCSLICIDAFVAVSTSSLSRLEDKVDDAIIKYKESQDEKVKEKAPDLSITPGGDETFFEKIMVLVCMDLNSGFIFNETIEENRKHKTWDAVTMPWLSKFKTNRCFLSDKARALLKLAKTSLGIDQIPDLFHMMNDLSKVMGASLGRLAKDAQKKLEVVTEEVKKGADSATNKGQIAVLAAKMNLLSIRKISYQKSLRRLSTTLHPFQIISSKAQNTIVVERNMLSSLNIIKNIKDELNISDEGKKLSRVERQIPEAAKQVDMWWSWVENSLSSSDINPEIREWLTNNLLPAIYWKTRIKKTHSKIIKRAYAISMKKAQTRLENHHLTNILINKKSNNNDWIVWAESMSNLFIRATSAIEGRNGWLSQMHFNARGLSSKRLRSQCAIHNYFLKRGDGTTACERLAGIQPEDMFEYILTNVGLIAEPRVRKNKAEEKALNLKPVPA